MKPSLRPRRPVARGAAAFAGLALGALLPLAGLAEERIAVVAVADAPAGPDAALAELAHQLRAACRDRVAGVLDVPTMQALLRGESDGATLAELDRAYGGALAVHQSGEFESALRTLQAIVADLEALPEGREQYQQWIRANLRLAHAAATIGRRDESDAALIRVLRIEPGLRADPDLYSPSYRRRMDELRARVAAMPQRRLTVLANGRPGSVFVDGRPSGTTPMTLFLPPGRYRIGGTAPPLRVPSVTVDLLEEDRTVVLDFETAESLRMSGGPGLALRPERRAEGLIRAGAWMDVDKLVVAARGVEGDAPFLVGSIYDVRRGALLREGSVRTVAGSVPAASVGALSAFLLTGAQQREVRALTATVVGAAGDAPTPAASAGMAEAAGPAGPEAGARPVGAEPEGGLAAEAVGRGASGSPGWSTNEDPAPAAAGSGAGASPGVPANAVDGASRPLDLRPVASVHGELGLAVAAPGGHPTAPGPDAALRPAPRRWMRPAAWASGGFALGFAALAVNRKLAADDAYDRADALLGPGDVLASSSDLARFRDLTAEGDAAKRAAWISAGASALFAAAAGFLGWSSAVPGPAVSF